MTDKTVTPSLGAKSFTCLHCGAVAHQTWFKLFRDGYAEDKYPWVPDQGMIDDIKSNKDLPGKEHLLKFLERRIAKELSSRITKTSCMSKAK